MFGRRVEVVVAARRGRVRIADLKTFMVDLASYGELCSSTLCHRYMTDIFAEDE